MARLESSVSEEFAEKTRKLLEGLACRHLDGAAVVFFGSRVDGTNNRRSDFDIAYLPREGFDPMSVVHLQEAIENSNVIYEVDLVDLSRVDASFREKVLAEGVVWKS